VHIVEFVLSRHLKQEAVLRGIKAMLCEIYSTGR